MIRVIFTGAQGVGKTTILNYFKEHGYNVITEVVRKLSKTGVKINQDGNKAGQMRIFDAYVEALTVKEDYISDRGLTDVLGYSYDLLEHDKLDKVEIMREIDQLVKFNKENPDVLYFYFPIEFPVVDDGVRSLDEDYRKRIDENILTILKNAKVPYIEVRGTVEERINIVKKAMALQSQIA